MMIPLQTPCPLDHRTETKKSFRLASYVQSTETREKKLSCELDRYNFSFCLLLSHVFVCSFTEIKKNYIYNKINIRFLSWQRNGKLR